MPFRSYMSVFESARDATNLLWKENSANGFYFFLKIHVSCMEAYLCRQLQNIPVTPELQLWYLEKEKKEKENEIKNGEKEEWNKKNGKTNNETNTHEKKPPPPPTITTNNNNPPPPPKENNSPTTTKEKAKKTKKTALYGTGCFQIISTALPKNWRRWKLSRTLAPHPIYAYTHTHTHTHTHTPLPTHTHTHIYTHIPPPPPRPPTHTGGRQGAQKQLHHRDMQSFLRIELLPKLRGTYQTEKPTRYWRCCLTCLWLFGSVFSFLHWHGQSAVFSSYGWFCWRFGCCAYIKQHFSLLEISI